MFEGIDFARLMKEDLIRTEMREARSQVRGRVNYQREP